MAISPPREGDSPHSKRLKACHRMQTEDGLASGHENHAVLESDVESIHSWSSGPVSQPSSVNSQDTEPKDAAPQIEAASAQRSEPAFCHQMLARGAQAARGTLRPTKWGRFVKCMEPMRFHVFQSGPKQGMPVLMCKQWFGCAYGSSHKCWGQKPFLRDRIPDLSASEQKLCSDVRAQLWFNQA